MHIDAFTSSTLAILLLFVGKGLTQRFAVLRRYSIPEPVIGGLASVIVVGTLYFAFDIQLTYDLEARGLLLLYFFATVGLGTELSSLRQGGRPLLILLALATGFIVLQNFLGMGVSSLFGLDPKAGLMAGSVSLTGGVGTTMAWAPEFTNRLGIANAAELGLACNMLGMVAACLIGGPVVAFLMKRHAIAPSCDADLEVGTLYDQESSVRLDYYGVLLALLWLNIVLMLGNGVYQIFAAIGLNLPEFVGCLMAGIVVRNAMPLMARPHPKLWNWAGMRQGVALISDLTLGVFLTMALMGMKIWELEGVLGFVAVVIALQILLAIFFIIAVLFRCLGKNYESAVMCAGFSGIALGSTATAIANMTAVTRQFGAAPKAFIVVPLVCGFFIDLVNALIVSIMI
ncbi:MAG: sodium/glutamate symporter [Candidimonas sp.]